MAICCRATRRKGSSCSVRCSDIPKSRLIATLKAAKVSYADDPSNRDPRFARPRLRELMPLLAAEGLTGGSPGAARVAGRCGPRLRSTRRCRRHCPSSRQRHGRSNGPVLVRCRRFYGLPDEIGLRVLERVVNWTGDEGPVELGKLEALCERAGRCNRDIACAPRGRSARFRRTLAGAVVTLDKGELRVERAPPRRARASATRLETALTKREAQCQRFVRRSAKRARMPWIRRPFAKADFEPFPWQLAPSDLHWLKCFAGYAASQWISCGDAPQAQRDTGLATFGHTCGQDASGRKDTSG